MSSTLRGAERNEEDYYVTPKWLIREFADATMQSSPSCQWPLLFNGKILDPSTGGCEKHDASYPSVLQEKGFDNVDSWDIRHDSRAELKGIDFLKIQGNGFYDTVITNPPFCLAEEFAVHALDHVHSSGHVILLQRLNWLGTKKRKPMWDKLPLSAVFVHHKRAGFIPERPSKKDSIEYAHFVFSKTQPKNTIPNLFII